MAPCRTAVYATISLILLGLTPGSLWSQNTASIQGIVIDKATAAPIQGAFVYANRSSSPPSSQYARSAADGAFLIQNLAAGTWRLCARFVSGAYLDSCEWGQTASSVVLTAGQKSAGNTLRPIAGSVLKVRIQDAAQTLFRPNALGVAPHLLMGIFARPGAWYPVRQVSRDLNGVNYELPVPFDTPLALTVMAAHMNLAGANGVAAPSTGIQAPFQHATGDPEPQNFTFTVLGVLP